MKNCTTLMNRCHLNWQFLCQQKVSMFVLVYRRCTSPRLEINLFFRQFFFAAAIVGVAKKINSSHFHRNEKIPRLQSLI